MRAIWKTPLCAMCAVAAMLAWPAAMGHSQDSTPGSTSPRAPTPELLEEPLVCLTEAIYFEARSENIAGKVAVAEVILNRRDSARFPDTVCAVVHQGYNPAKPKRHRCQFSYYCDGNEENVYNLDEYEAIRALAWSLLRSGERPLTGGATHYHATYVKPFWARKMEMVRVVDSHVFYRTP